MYINFFFRSNKKRMYRVCMHFLLVTLSLGDVAMTFSAQDEPVARLGIAPERPAAHEISKHSHLVTPTVPTKPPTEPLEPNDYETIIRKSTELIILPSPFPEFPEYIIKEFEEFKQNTIHLMHTDIADELARIEDYLVNVETSSMNRLLTPEEYLSTELEVENVKLKQFTLYLVYMTHSLADANSILVVMIFFLLLIVLTVSARCRSRSQVDTASNTTENETIKV